MSDNKISAGEIETTEDLIKILQRFPAKTKFKTASTSVGDIEYFTVEEYCDSNGKTFCALRNSGYRTMHDFD